MKVNKSQRLIISILLILIIALLLVLWFIFNKKEKQEELIRKQTEQENIKIDEYNFKQLEKAKPILDNIPKDAKKFKTLKKFNELYNAWIEPIKNCYYVSNLNWKYPYIFWFKLESEKYKNKYWEKYYVYPNYDLPFTPYCWWSKDCQDDINKWFFLSVISYHCDSDNSMLRTIIE